MSFPLLPCLSFMYLPPFPAIHQTTSNALQVQVDRGGSHMRQDRLLGKCRPRQCKLLCRNIMMHRHINWTDHCSIWISDDGSQPCHSQPTDLLKCTTVTSKARAAKQIGDPVAFAKLQPKSAEARVRLRGTTLSSIFGQLRILCTPARGEKPSNKPFNLIIGSKTGLT